MKKLLLTFTSFGLLISNAYSFDQAQDDAQALITIEQALSIDQVQDLDFGLAYSGASANSVEPGDDNAAVFEVSGEQDTAYSITLPTSIEMTHIGGSGATIEVNNFTSLPAVGDGGLINSSGTQELRVGATHEAISSNQDSGDYAGVFTVEVAY